MISLDKTKYLWLLIGCTAGVFVSLLGLGFMVHSHVGAEHGFFRWDGFGGSFGFTHMLGVWMTAIGLAGTLFVLMWVFIPRPKGASG